MGGAGEDGADDVGRDDAGGVTRGRWEATGADDGGSSLGDEDGATCDIDPPVAVEGRSEAGAVDTGVTDIGAVDDAAESLAGAEGMDEPAEVVLLTAGCELAGCPAQAPNPIIPAMTTTAILMRITGPPSRSASRIPAGTWSGDHPAVETERAAIPLHRRWLSGSRLATAAGGAVLEWSMPEERQAPEPTVRSGFANITGPTVDVLVIGAGQAGLSAAFHLQRNGVGYRMLDAEDGPGGAWQHRWATLTMRTVNGIRELPGSAVPPVDPRTPARIAIPAYFSDYEREFGLVVERPRTVVRVESVGDLLVATTSSGTAVPARALINATGTWTRPFWPYYPGAAQFRGRQLHTHDYRAPGDFDGARVMVIGGGISAVQALMELATHTAEQYWVTRRPPVWVEREFTSELGRAAVAMVTERVSRGLPPRSVVSVTGLGLTPEVRAAREAGVLRRREMFESITPTGVRWADGTTTDVDVLFWCTGFRAALDHLAPLGLRAPGGGILMDGTAVAKDRRVHLVGYGPSASTIGANRAGRLAVRDVRRLLALSRGTRPESTSGWSPPKR